jgi:hypothetical protein
MQVFKGMWPEFGYLPTPANTQCIRVMDVKIFHLSNDTTCCTNLNGETLVFDAFYSAPFGL